MEETTQNTTKKSNTPIIVMFIGIVIILAASAAGYWYMSNREDSADTNNDEETEQEGNDSEEISEETSSNGEYSVNTPDGWLEDDGSYSNMNLDEINARVFFPEEEVNNPDGFAENVNILIQDAEGYDSESYNELSLTQIEAVSGEIIESGEIEMAGEDGYELEYSIEDSIYYQRYVVIDGTAYLITYTGTEAEYDAYIDEALEIFDSFELN